MVAVGMLGLTALWVTAPFAVAVSPAGAVVDAAPAPPSSPPDAAALVKDSTHHKPAVAPSQGAVAKVVSVLGLIALLVVVAVVVGRQLRPRRDPDRGGQHQEPS